MPKALPISYTKDPNSKNLLTFILNIKGVGSNPAASERAYGVVVALKVNGSCFKFKERPAAQV